MKKQTVLILGVTGMVGSDVFSYLSQKPELQIFGTTRQNKKDTFLLHVETAQKDLASIYKKLHKIDVMINCIGEIEKTADKTSLILTNSWFPHILEEITKKNNTLLIHISTDAVFGKNQKEVTEKSIPYPDTIYGISKFLGETDDKHAITVRTSFLGFPFKNFNGYTNQKWSGCTTLQFAKFCAQLLERDFFITTRKQTSLYHFCPIVPTTKYTIAKTINKFSKQHRTIEKMKGEKIRRVLASFYSNSVLLRSYSKNIKESLQELYDYHKKI